jgi:WD40 repeat protein
VTGDDDRGGLPGPYKGLAPFEDSELDALLFFGRDAEQEVITANLLASRLTVLYGPSGCGKSSVLRAGVAHRLRRQAETNIEDGRPPEHAVVVFDRWSDDPAEGIAEAVADAVAPLAGPLAGENGAASLSDRIEAWVEHLGGELYLVLDQAEEYFLYRPQEGQDEFARALPELVGRPDLPVNVVVSLREDALGRLDVFRAGIPTLFGNTLRLALLDDAAAREAVVGPLARYAGLAGADGPDAIEPELIDAVLADTRAGEIELTGGTAGARTPGSGDGVETAFLQLVLLRIWETEREQGSRTLRLQTFRELGGAERIVQDHLGAALAGFTPEQRDAAAEAFNHLVTPSGTKVAHGLSDLATYSGVAPTFLAPVLSALAEQRILRPLPPVDGSTDPRYEIFHDVLAGPIRGWRSEHETERRLAGERRESRRRHRRLLGVTIASLVGLAIAIGLAILALAQRSEAKEQAQVSRSRELAASALGEVGVDPELGVLVALEAAYVAPTPQAESALRDSLIASRARTVLTGHQEAVTKAIFSPDGAHVATASPDGTARLYDLAGGAPVVFGHDAAVTSVDFSPNGDRIVTAAMDGSIRVWSTSGEIVDTYIHEGGAHGASFDARGERVLSWGADGTARLWSSPTERVVFRHGAPVLTAALSPAEDRVVTGGEDGTAQVFEASSGAFLELLPHERPVTGATFSPDGSLMATTSRDRIARIWSTVSWELVRGLDEHRNTVTSATFTPDGRLLVTTSRDGGSRVFDIATGLRTVLVVHANEVWGAALSADGSSTASVSLDGGAVVWETLTGRILAALVGHSDAVNSAAFGPDASTVVTASDDGTARVWDASIGPALDPVALLGSSTRAAFSPDGQLILATATKARPRLLRLDTGEAVAWFDHDGATSAALSRDGALAATADEDEDEVRVWNLPDARLVTALELPAPAVAVEFDPTSSSLLVAGGDGVARILALDTGAELLGVEDGTGIADATFSPDGSQVATAGEDGTARIWDASTGQLLHELTGHEDALTSVAFSPDGRTLATASADTDARVWNAETGEELRLLRGHFGPVFEASFSPDGHWIVTAGPVIAGLWEAETGHLLFYLRGNAAVLTGAMFDPTGRWIITTNRAGGIRSYGCQVCGPIGELVPLAEEYVETIGRELTDEQRQDFGIE